MSVTNSQSGILLLAALALAAAGCATGHDGDVNIGGGQEPDPVVLDFPVAYVKGPLPDGTEDVRELEAFQAGSDLWLRDRAAPDSPERNLTFALTGGLWNVRDVDVSFDGNKLIFTMRRPLIPGAMDSEQPTWNIYEYDRPTDTLRRVIASDLVAEEGHDVAPNYLPDGRIVFSSTRQSQSKAVLTDEGKPQFAALDEDRNEHAFVLHVMNPDGTIIRQIIRQISFNQSHDMDPAVLADGRIVFSRWENASGSSIHLYTVNPDGSGLELLYGANSHATGTGTTGTGTTQVQFLSSRPRPDGSIVALLRPFNDTELGGDPVSIDATSFVEIQQPTLANAGLAGPAQTRLSINDVRTDPGPSPGGRFASIFPMWDGTNRLLVSWTMCRLLEGGLTVPCTASRLADPAAVTAPPLYGVWIYDPRDRTQRPVLQPTEGVRYSDVVLMAPRAPLPSVILDAVPGVDYDRLLAPANENVGILNIKSVYDWDGADVAPGGITALRDPAQTTADERPARFLRVEKAVGLPDDEVRDFRGTAFGAAGGLGMREILAYAPIEPDGSVQIKLPAGVPFAVSVVDRNGRRITPRHLNWMQLRAGEVVTCNGCHVPAGAQTPPAVSHGRRGLFASVNPGAPTTGQPFPNTNAALFANLGETMAEARARISCQTDCAAQLASVDVIYDDVWTDPVTAGRPADASFSYRYSQLMTPAPTSASCQSNWSSRCRITINYPDHLQPLWTLSRLTLDTGGAVIADRTCVACHSPADAAGVVRVPAVQLDLSGGPSPDEPDQLVSYRELLFTDNGQEVNMGVLQDYLVPGPPDPVTGLPTLVTVPVSPSMSAAGANASATFFSRFDVGGSHAGDLTPAELRLIAEWLDIGGQYYNDPFMAPTN
jgi:hypothetical protein